MWVPPEVKEPVLLHAPTRKSVGYFGAVRLRDGKFIYAREEDKFNGRSCWQFLKQLRQGSLRSSKRVVIIIDNAKYHHALLHKAWREEAMPRFRLDFLPPYSPDLNPIERVWKLTRRLCLHNVYFPKLDQVRETAERQFDQWSGGSSTLNQAGITSRSPDRACHPHLQPTQECVYQGRRSCPLRLPVSRAGVQTQLAKHAQSACAGGRLGAACARIGEAPQHRAQEDLFRSGDFLSRMDYPL
jgi:transposase